MKTGMLEFIPRVLGNLFGGPATRLYPFEKREPFAKARGRITIDIEKCIFCQACMRRCPSRALEVVREECKWTLHPLRCIVCFACVEVCPTKAIVGQEEYRLPAYSQESHAFVGKPRKPARSKEGES